MNLEQFFNKNQVIKLKADKKQVIIKQMLEKLQELGYIENKERYYAQVLHRESLENTGIGSGFAIPHARTDSVSEFITILAILDEGIDYQAFDDKPVQYILLSIFPTDLSTTYLYLIGMMARIFSTPEKKAHLDSETAPSKIYSILKKEATEYYNSVSDKESVEYETPENLSTVPSSDLALLIRLDRLYQFYEDSGKSESIGKKIKDLKKLIDNRSLTYYERMRKKRNNPFAIVEKNSCTGCHMEIPPYYRSEVKDGKGIPICEYCGRFLIEI